MKSPTQILSDLRNALDSSKCEDVPAHMKTAVAWSAAWGLRSARTRDVLNDAVKIGHFKIVEYRVRTAAGVRKVPHYGPVKP